MRERKIKSRYGNKKNDSKIQMEIRIHTFPMSLGAFQFVAGWRGRQSGRRPTAHNQFGRAIN